MFTYREGDEASYFVISDKFEGGAADVGPSGAGEDKESSMASSSREQFTEPAASEGESDTAPITEALGPMKFSLRPLLVLLLPLPGFLLWSRLKSAPPPREPRRT